MSAVATAVVGAAAIGAYSADKAADKVASAGKKGIASTEALAKQARTDAINLFQQARISSQNGIGGALNFYQQNAQKRIAPAVQGNMAAQQILGQGATQANNAILGLPVDMSFANSPKQISADYSGINKAKLPTLGAVAVTEPAAPLDTKNRLVTPLNRDAAIKAASGMTRLGVGR